MTPSTPPKGSLEELFRHHLLESEAAAVRPRPQVWEQVDNSLLLAQNEKYRRRLLAYRWAVAASLLLASLAGGGWWRSQYSTARAPSLAQATTQPGRVRQPAGPATEASFSITNPSAIDQTATLPAPAAATSSNASLWAGRQPHQPAASYVAQTVRPAHGRTGNYLRLAAPYQAAATAGYRGAAAGGDGLAGATSLQAASSGFTTLASTTPGSPGQPASQAPATAVSASAAAAGAELVLPAADMTAPAAAEATLAAISASRSGLRDAEPAAAETTLAARWASLPAPVAAGLPASLTEVAVAPGPPLELSRRWQYGLSYSASAYRPNIDWTKPTVAYNNALGFSSASLTRSAAAEYRDNLRPGLGQRLSLWATRRLGNGRWSLRTGLEVAQNTASSASSVAFVGEQVADVSYTQAGFAYSPVSQATAHPLQRTSYRYRSVSVPAELRYANPLKTGFSFYGRVGAFVSALLNVRSEVEGSPEATRTYTLQSASTPYRPLSGGLRAGAGMQYRPAGHQWSLNFGPVAELGILSLNADPSQDFWGQQRPYSFGLEAGVELGRGFKIQ